MTGELVLNGISYRGQSEQGYISQITIRPVGATCVQHDTVYLNKLLMTCVRPNMHACLAHETKV